GPAGLHGYGDEQAAVQAMPGAQRVLGAGLTEAMVRFAARFEYARSVEDVLARRSRVLFLDARLAREMAQPVADILQQETARDPQLAAFLTLAQQYLMV
ncbi:MAG: glycerol-3-phosphate dehydrogenase C-terminal domain-containing protein, partial [Betaproteobacteria bacterium]